MDIFEDQISKPEIQFLELNKDITHNDGMFPDSLAIHGFLKMFLTSGVMCNALKYLDELQGTKPTDAQLHDHLINLKSVMTDLDKGLKFVQSLQKQLNKKIDYGKALYQEKATLKRSIYRENRQSTENLLKQNILLNKYKDLCQLMRVREKSALNQEDYELQLLNRLQFVKLFAERVKVAKSAALSMETANEQLKEHEDIENSINVLRSHVEEEKLKNKKLSNELERCDRLFDDHCNRARQISRIWSQVVYTSQLSKQNTKLIDDINSGQLQFDKRVQSMYTLIEQYILSSFAEQIFQRNMMTESVVKKEDNDDIHFDSAEYSEDDTCKNIKVESYTDILSIPGVHDWFAKTWINVNS
ncbi:hypothetical protein GJ496_010291 [Pomphorhynchus laevis]|nr:hypothetical protein GJ496_010291 [Pomphorhynchus laevis]